MPRVSGAPPFYQEKIFPGVIIDRRRCWSPVAELIFRVREPGATTGAILAKNTLADKFIQGLSTVSPEPPALGFPGLLKGLIIITASPSLILSFPGLTMESRKHWMPA